MIKMHGTILELGTLDMGKLTFPKDCEITYPEKYLLKMGLKGTRQKYMTSVLELFLKMVTGS